MQRHRGNQYHQNDNHPINRVLDKLKIDDFWHTFKPLDSPVSAE
jgi:hypothetical protein